MKIITGLLVGVAMLLSGVASAQYYSQASVSGTVLSYGPQGFMLQGPDGNYGIAVTQTTVVTDPWNSVIVTGPGNVVPGDYVTAIGYPTDQWIMQASRVIVRNANPPAFYGGAFGTNLITGAGVIRTPNMFPNLQQGIPTFNTLPTPNNTFNPLPTPLNNTFNTLPTPANNTFINPFAMRVIRR
jgi:hypothetical protein